MKENFFLWNQGINSFILMRRMNLWCPIVKRKEIIMWICIYTNWKMNFNSKNYRMRSFSYEAKAIISLIPMKRKCLWSLITKRKKIIMWICVCPTRWTNINSKTGRKRSFSYETKALMSFITMRKMCLWFLIMKTKEILVNPHVS